MNKPTIGRVVTYNTTEEEQGKMYDSPTCNLQKQLPAIIVAVWSDSLVNLNVQLDGEGSMWATSRNQGDNPGEWNWPEIK